MFDLFILVHVLYSMHVNNILVCVHYSLKTGSKAWHTLWVKHTSYSVKLSAIKSMEISDQPFIFLTLVVTDFCLNVIYP